MTIRLSLLCFLGLLLRTVLCSSDSDLYKLEDVGFSKVCQEAIAMTAMSKIEVRTLASLKRFLHNKDAVDVVHWGNKVANLYHSTETYHFQRIPYKEGVRRENHCTELSRNHLKECRDAPCLLDALIHFYVRLTYPDRLADYPMTYPKDMAFTEADALKFVINLITEVHNPGAYHVEGELYLPSVTGQLQVSRDHHIDTDAHNLARGQICDFYSIAFASNWNSGWTHYRALSNSAYSDVEKDLGTTPEEASEAFAKWAMEAASQRCDFMQEFHDDFKVDIRQADILFKKHFHMPILKAGIRMAAVIQKILENHKPDSSLRKSDSGIDVPVEISYGKQKIRKVESSERMSHVILINVCIVSILLFLGWAFLVRDPYVTEKTYGTGANEKQESPSNVQSASGIAGSKGISTLNPMRGKDKSN